MTKETIYLGIEIGGTKLQIVTGNAAGEILERHRLTVAAAEGAAGIRRQIEATVSKIVAVTKLAAVGVGFGGPVDWRSGKIWGSHQIKDWSEFDLGGWLHQLTGAPVFVDNDANLAALAEALHGAGVGANPVFYVTLGSGMGAGLVVDGKIYHGAPPGESEIGHLRLDRQGTIAESRCSGWAVDAKTHIYIVETSDPLSPLTELIRSTPGGEARHLAAALPDPAAQRILRETAEDLAFALSHVVHLFHPQIIVIGGGLSGVGEPLRLAVETALRPFIMEVFLPGPRVALTALGEDAVPVGALELARGRS